MKVLALISGGIDSPVALELILKRNVECKCVIFESSPFTNKDEIETAKKTINILSKKYETKLKTFIVPHGKTQEYFLKNIEKEDLKYGCIFSRRMMLRISEKIAKEQNCDFLLTGDCLGQVASQTLDNLLLIGGAVKLPVLRPLLGLDKTEIVNIAKNIGTFETSILGGIACAVNTDYPETHGKVNEIESIEKKLEVEQLIKTALENKTIIEL